MDIVRWITDTADSLPLALVWALGGLFAFLENGIGLGFFLPGETAVLLFSAAVGTPWAALVMLLVVAVAGSAGDHVGYLLGRRFGEGLRETRLIRRLGVDNWDRAVEVLRSKGSRAIFLTRLVPVVRTLTPPAAGVARVPYRSFLAASLAGALTWSLLYVGLGFLLRSSLDAVEKYLSSGGTVLLVAAAVAAAAVVLVRAVRRRRRPEPAPVSGSAASAGDVEGAGPATGSGRAQDPAPSARARLQAHRFFAHGAWRTWPNLISFLRLLLLPVFATALVLGSEWTALVVIGVVFATDWLDGWLARRTGSVSELGTWLDPVADRVTAVVVVVAFGAAHLLPWQAIALVLVPDLLLGIAAAVLFRGDPAIPVTVVGKVRTALLFGGLLIVLVGQALATGPGGLGWTAVIGLGFAVFLLGAVGHWIAAAQYARAMIARRLGEDAPRRGVS